MTQKLRPRDAASDEEVNDIVRQLLREDKELLEKLAAE